MFSRLIAAARIVMPILIFTAMALAAEAGMRWN
jgi:hypothetical protein